MFRLTPLITKILLALAVLVPIGVLYAVNAEAVEIWAQRLYLLRDRTWPRNTEIQVAGIQFQRITTAEGVPTLSELIPFDENREIKVAKGTSVLLRVLADATKVDPGILHGVLPDGGERSRHRQHAETGPHSRQLPDVHLRWKTVPRHPLQHHVRRARVRPSRAGLSADRRAEPVHRRDQARLRRSRRTWSTSDCRCGMPRTLDLASGTQLPNGTRITLRARSNKDLVKVDIRDVQSETTTVYEVAKLGSDPRQIEYVDRTASTAI